MRSRLRARARLLVALLIWQNTKCFMSGQDMYYIDIHLLNDTHLMNEFLYILIKELDFDTPMTTPLCEGACSKFSATARRS